jgi:hypothetical protein
VSLVAIARSKSSEYAKEREVKWQGVGGKYKVRSHAIGSSLPNARSKTKSRRMSQDGHEARATEMRTNSWLESLKGKHQSEGLDADARIILKRNNGRAGAVDWIQLTQNRERWRALVNAVMNLGVRLRGLRIPLLAERLSASQGLGSFNYSECV